jgi:hypothetical protein
MRPHRYLARIRRPGALIALVAAALFTSCFNPELSQEIGCYDGACPGRYECINGVCVASGRPRADADPGASDADTPEIDAVVAEDADTPPHDVGPPADAGGPRIECDPRLQDCFDPDNPRCALVITQQGPPHDAILACILERGDRLEDEACAYTTGSRGLEDNCAFGLICDYDRGRCRVPCREFLDCAPSHACEGFQNLQSDLDGFGLCQPCTNDDDSPCLDAPA